MKRIARYIFILLLILITLLTWLSVTESGLRWVYHRAIPYLPAGLALGKIEGTLFGPITIRDFQYEQEGTLVKTDRLLFDWQPSALLIANINISRVDIQTLNITLTDAKKVEQTPTGAITLPDIHLPWMVRLNNAQISNFSLTQNGQTTSINQIRLSASSLFSQLKIKQLSVKADTFSLNINGKIKPSGDYSHHLNIDWETSLPSQAVIKGKGQLVGNIETTTITQQVSRPLQLTLEAQVNDLLDQLNWQSKVDIPEVELSKLDKTLPALQAALTLEASGDLAAAKFALHLNTMKGSAIAAGKLSWSPTLSWTAEVNASDIDPATLFPQWPGQIKARVLSEGQYVNKHLTATVDINQLEGRLRGYPVSLNSRQQWKNDSLVIKKFVFYSGKSQLNLQGEINNKLNLKWAIASDDLAELYPLVKGQFHANGDLRGLPATPFIKASINGKALQLENNHIGSIEGELSVDLFKWQQINIDLTAQALNLNDFLLDRINVVADNQHIKTKASTQQLTTEIELRGEATNNGWRGHIQQADLQSTAFDSWQLIDPVAIAINSETKTFSADELCWSNKKVASLCLSVEEKDTAWHSRLIARDLPLLLLNALLPPDMKIEGIANATAELEYRAPDSLLGQAHISLPAGAISYPLLEGEHERWEYKGGNVNITLNEKRLQAASNFALSNGDQFHAKMILPEINLLAVDTQHQTIEANAQLNIHDLDIIEAFIPDIQNLRGEIKMNVTVNGTLEKPKINGFAHISDGALNIPRLGLKITQLNLSADTDGLDKIKFKLSAHSGDGNLTIQGQTLVDSANGWPTEITIKGEQFTVAKITEAHVIISPDLQTTIKNHTIETKGKVHIPYANLKPKDMTTADRISDDAVIVGGELTTEKKWLIYNKIRVTLGERVNFFGFGFEGRFAGSLLLEDEPGQLTRATGEITIPEGRYRAYGQRLDVESGRVLFTGGPLTNPGLDLRAVRHVNGVTAGLHVKGSLNQPQIELFSVPSMGQSDALSYLLLGRPMESSTSEEGSMMAKAALALSLSGGDHVARVLGDKFGLDEMRVESSDNGDQASLAVGRYLSPKLYVSYGVGLIEAINTLTVRYQISSKWQLKAESGEAQGADIFYTIER